MGKVGEWEDAEPGVRRMIREVGRNIMSMVVTFEEGAEGYAHAHPHEQLSYVLAGELEFTVGEEIRRVRQGDSVYIPGDVRHGVKALTAASLLDVFTPVREDLLG